MPKVVDLRSDTVTRPVAAMRQAIIHLPQQFTIDIASFHQIDNARYAAH